MALITVTRYYDLFVGSGVATIMQAMGSVPVRVFSAASLTQTLLVLFSDSLGVGFAVRIEEFLAALLPRRLEFGRCDVPVWSAFFGNGT